MNKGNARFRLLKLLPLLGLVSVILYYSFNMESSTSALLILLGVLGILVLPYFLQSISFALQLIVFLVPLSIDLAIAGETKVSLPSELLLIIVTFAVIIKWLGGMKINFQVLNHPISYLLLFDILWTIIAAFLSEIPSVSFKRALIKGLFVLVFYALFLLFFKKTETFKRIYYLYGIGIIIPIIYTTYAHSVFQFKQKASVLVSMPFFAEHTIYAAVVAFLIPFFFIQLFERKKSFTLTLAVLLLLLIALFLSYSRAAWISLVVASLFYLLTKLKINFNQFVLGVIVMALIGSFSFNTVYDELKRTNSKYGDEVSQHLTSVTNLQNDASNLERINRWASAVEMFKARPLTGFGPGTYQFVYDQYQETRNMTRISTHLGTKGNAHSEYLMYLSEVGIIGFLIFISILFYSIFIALKLLRKPIKSENKHLLYAAILGLITFFIHSLFNSFLDSEKIAALYFGSLASLVWLDNKSKINANENEMDSDTDTISIAKN